jgi:hypothetical protein
MEKWTENKIIEVAAYATRNEDYQRAQDWAYKKALECGYSREDAEEIAHAASHEHTRYE